MNGRLLMALGGRNKAALGSEGPRSVALEADLVAHDIKPLSPEPKHSGGPPSRVTTSRNCESDSSPHIQTKPV